MTAHLWQSLTAAQREAVEHVDGPLLILAGPGSGKTRVVTHRVAYLLRQGIASRNILALTFTNKAADEMRGRLTQLAPGQQLWIGTFHRFCARLLRQYAPYVGLSENFTIYDTSDSERCLKATLAAAERDLSWTTPERLARAISQCKNQLISADDYRPPTGNPLGAILQEVYPAYQRRLLASNAVDFDDLLLHVARLLRTSDELRALLDERFRYILVDEYQDTNLAQYAIVRALSVDHPNLAVTGDPDQSIYGWRGANLSNILEFERDYPDVRVVRLEQNYRSTGHILHVADVLIRHNARRKPKALFTDNPRGAPVRLTAYDTQQREAEGIAAEIAAEVHPGRRRPRDYAVFYRVNALSRSLEHALRDQGLPYQIVNGVEFYQRREIKDVLSYLRLLNNPRDDVALERIINTPPRGIGRTTLLRLRQQAQAQGGSLRDACGTCQAIAGLSRRAAKAVGQFARLIDRLEQLAAQPVREIIQQVLDLSGYRQYLGHSDAAEDVERLANVEELLTAAEEFDRQHPGEGQLEEFLEQASLVNDTDAWEDERDKVTLMTLHAAKGLEFPVVYIIAVEQGLLPHELSRHENDRLEEERRLLFVGITRAQQSLQLSMAQYRDFRGQHNRTVPSEFLLELPPESLHVVNLQPGTAAQRPETFDQDQSDTNRPAPVRPPRGARRGGRAPAGVTTAAHLLADEPDGGSGTPPQAPPPDQFSEGMAVLHPTYGPGKIVALSGDRERRRATVRFANGSGQRTFVLSQSPLRPAR